MIVKLGTASRETKGAFYGLTPDGKIVAQTCFGPNREGFVEDLPY